MSCDERTPRTARQGPASAEVAAPTELTGRCACGAVQLTARAPLRPVIGCHCETCRRQSGHIVAATACRREALTVEGEESLNWWSAEPGFRRGFCATCGSLLFWEREGSGMISIMAGCLDRPTGLSLEAHIFVAEAGDYYRLGDGVPVFEGAARCLQDFDVCDDE